MSETITLSEIQRDLGIGRTLAERYARESGALLPRAKGGRYVISRKKWNAWLKGANHEA